MLPLTARAWLVGPPRVPRSVGVGVGVARTAGVLTPSTPIDMTPRSANLRARAGRRQHPKASVVVKLSPPGRRERLPNLQKATVRPLSSVGARHGGRGTAGYPRG